MPDTPSIRSLNVAKHYTHDYIILIQSFKLLLVSMSCFMDVSVDCGCFIGQSSFNCSRVFCFYNIEITI